MLAGLAALAVPVVIHLLLKRKKQRLRFSTIRFFAKQDEQSSRKRKIRNWLLLAMRLLLFALLVLAFARPYLPQAKASASARQRRQVVFVIDRSASMQAADVGGGRWSMATDRIQKMLAELAPEDRVALVSCSSHAEVLSAFGPPAAAEKIVRELRPTSGAGHLADGLAQAAKLLTLSDANVRSTICVVSDFQRTSCERLSSVSLADAIELKTIAVGDLLAPNMAVTELQSRIEPDAQPRVAAGNFSEEESATGKFELSVDGKGILSQPLKIAASAFTNIQFSLPALKPGWHEVVASIATKDPMPLDDRRFATLFVVEPWRALVVEPRKAGRVFEEESFFIATALEPSKDPALPGAFRVTKIFPEELQSKLAIERGERPFNFVLLPRLHEPPSGIASALKAFVEAGGGVAFFAGEGISANRYNAEFRDLLPAQLGTVEMVSEAEPGWRIGQFDTNTLVFAAFQQRNSGDLTIPKFTARMALRNFDAAEQPAFFEDGAPLLLTRSIGRGRAAWINTSADASWTDWPKHKTFVPWIHGLGKYLAQSRKEHELQQTNSFVAGEDFEIDMGAPAKGSAFKVVAPSGDEAQVLADSKGKLPEALFSVPGIYAIKNSAGKEMRRVSVNVPASESDLSALAPADFEQQIARTHQPPKVASTSGLFSSSSNQNELWRVLLLGVLTLLFIEEFAANRTSL